MNKVIDKAIILTANNGKRYIEIISGEMAEGDTVSYDSKKYGPQIFTVTGLGQSYTKGSMPTGNDPLYRRAYIEKASA